MKRVSSLEGIRGIASIMVMLSHLGVMFYPAYYWNKEMSHCNAFDYYFGHTPFSFILNGNSGVMFFLIITGFGSYMIVKKGIDAARKYAILRYFKLLTIALISSLIVWFLASKHIVFYEEVAIITKTPWFTGFSPLNLQWGNIIKNNPLFSLQSYNSALWTMEFFFTGSLIALFLTVIGDCFPKRMALYIIFIFVLINMEHIYYVPCVLGALLADYYSMNYQHKCSNRKGGLMILIGIYLCAYPTGSDPVLCCYDFLPYEHMLYYHIVGAACIIYAALFWEKCSDILNVKCIQFLGKYSLSIYVLHYSILISFSAYLFLNLQSVIGYNLSCAVTFISTIIVVLVLAVLIDKLFRFIYKGLDAIYDKCFMYLH